MNSYIDSFMDSYMDGPIGSQKRKRLYGDIMVGGVELQEHNSLIDKLRKIVGYFGNEEITFSTNIKKYIREHIKSVDLNQKNNIDFINNIFLYYKNYNEGKFEDYISTDDNKNKIARLYQDINSKTITIVPNGQKKTKSINLINIIYDYANKKLTELLAQPPTQPQSSAKPPAEQSAQSSAQSSAQPPAQQGTMKLDDAIKELNVVNSDILSGLDVIKNGAMQKVNDLQIIIESKIDEAVSPIKENMKSLSNKLDSIHKPKSMVNISSLKNNSESDINKMIKEQQTQLDSIIQTTKTDIKKELITQIDTIINKEKTELSNAEKMSNGELVKNMIPLPVLQQPVHTSILKSDAPEFVLSPPASVPSPASASVQIAINKVNKNDAEKIITSFKDNKNKILAKTTQEMDKILNDNVIFKIILNAINKDSQQIDEIKKEDEKESKTNEISGIIKIIAKFGAEVKKIYEDAEIKANSITEKLDTDIKKAENEYDIEEKQRDIEQRNNIIKAISIIALVIVCGISLVFGINEYRRSLRRSRRKHKDTPTYDI